MIVLKCPISIGNEDYGFLLIQQEVAHIYAGPVLGMVAGATIDLGTRSKSILSAVPPNATSGTYTVASFHTHTPTVYRDAATLGAGRGNGPSTGDLNADVFDNVAGVVYDYTANPVPPLHPKSSTATLFNSRNQRSLVAE